MFRHLDVQFLTPLLAGARVHILEDEVALDPSRLLGEVVDRRISILQVVPSMLLAMLGEIPPRGPSRRDPGNLRWLFSTGEALPPETCRKWFEAYPEVPLINGYGPTEYSDNVSHAPMASFPQGMVRMTIGRPLINQRLRVLDRALQPVPIGIPGELFVGGVGVGRGYLGDPRRTAETFLPQPAGEETGARLYRTGDLVRLRHDGALEYLGRLDHQVKVRGHRIELGEIETLLGRYPRIREAVVVTVEQAGQKLLVAYAVADRQPPPPLGELRRFLGEQLPEYMLPSTVVFLDRFPLTPKRQARSQGPARAAGNPPGAGHRVRAAALPGRRAAGRYLERAAGRGKGGDLRQLLRARRPFPARHPGDIPHS